MYEYSTMWIVVWTLSRSVRIDSGRNDVVTMSYVGASRRQVDRNMKDRGWQAAEHYGILRRGGWSLSASLARLDYIDIEKTKYRHADAHYINALYIRPIDLHNNSHASCSFQSTAGVKDHV